MFISNTKQKACPKLSEGHETIKLYLASNKRYMYTPGPEVIKLFSYSIQLSTKFILLINVKMPTIVNILTFISMINTTFERLKARNSVELSMKKVL